TVGCLFATNDVDGTAVAAVVAHTLVVGLAHLRRHLEVEGVSVLAPEIDGEFLDGHELVTLGTMGWILVGQGRRPASASVFAILPIATVVAVATVTTIATGQPRRALRAR